MSNACKTLDVRILFFSGEYSDSSHISHIIVHAI